MYIVHKSVIDAVSCGTHKYILDLLDSTVTTVVINNHCATLKPTNKEQHQ